MSDVIRIPLSPLLQQRLAAMRADLAVVQNRLNDTVTAAVAQANVDPASVMGWDINYSGPELVCTPPSNGKHPEEPA